MELVSVIVPMYRGEKYIEQAVRSALAQTYRTLEVIVVDDGSPDEGAAVVEGIHDDRLRMIRQQNQGVAGARNTGLSEASSLRSLTRTTSGIRTSLRHRFPSSLTPRSPR